jgi:hypothetical protein
VVMVKGMLFVVLMKVEGGWLWRNDRIDHRTEVVLRYCLDEFVEEKVKGTTGNMAGEMVAIALCG